MKFSKLSSFVLSGFANFVYEERNCLSFQMKIVPDVHVSKRPNFHQVLEQAGKTILRPGAMKASRRLHSWANLNQESRVLELASGLGRSGIEIAQSYGCQEILVSDTDGSRLEQAKARIVQLGLQDQVATRIIDMFRLDQAFYNDYDDNPKRFDTIVTEASLTHYPTQRKAAFLKSIANICDPSQILLHEVCIRSDCSKEKLTHIRRDVGNILGVGFYPETLETYRQILGEAGFELQEFETGPLRQLNPIFIIRDEGLIHSLQISMNIILNSRLRARLFEGRKVLSGLSHDLGFIIARATKND